MPQYAPAGSQPPELKELLLDPQHACCAYGNVVLTRSLCAPDPVYLTRWLEALHSHARSHPLGLGLIVFIDADAKPPNDAERKDIRHAYASVASVVRGAVQVVEGQGFVAAAMRGALTVINMTKGLGLPIKVTSTVREAVPKLASLLGPAMDPRIDEAALTRAAAMMRVPQSARVPRSPSTGA